MSEEPRTAEQPWTIARLLSWTTGFLDQSQVDSPRLAAELLLAHVLDCAKIDLYARFEYAPTEEEKTAFRDLVRRAAEQEPVAYLIGRKEFYSLNFEVTSEVLIPRPETETLVERVIDYCRGADLPQANFLDMGTGSGCIAVALLTQMPEACGVGSDISPAALAVAGRNAATHDVVDRLRLVAADGLRLPEGCSPEGGFDLIVSNAPYVAEADMDTLPENVRRYEPSLALTAGPDGLRFYRHMHEWAPKILKPAGSLFIEIGAGMSAEVREVLETAGAFEHAGTWSDATDPHDRVMQFVRST